jgi:hypothetical protein
MPNQFLIVSIVIITEIIKESIRIKNNITNTNSDNKGKLFVTVFAFAHATKTGLQCSYRDRATARVNHLHTGINSGPLINLVLRYP